MTTNLLPQKSTDGVCIACKGSLMTYTMKHVRAPWGVTNIVGERITCVGCDGSGMCFALREYARETWGNA